MSRERIFIDKKELVTFYSKEGKSLQSIADHYGCSTTTIERNMRRHKIQIRDPRWISYLYKTREDALTAVKKVFAAIGQPFTHARFDAHMGRRGYASTAFGKFGWLSLLADLNIKLIQTSGGAATASVAGPPHPRSSPPPAYKANDPCPDAKLINVDRSTLQGFRKYMLERPIIYKDLTGLACTEANVKATYKQYVAVESKKGKEHAEETSSRHAKRRRSNKTGCANSGHHLQGNAGRGEIIAANHCRRTYQGGTGGRNMLDLPAHDLAGSGGA